MPAPPPLSPNEVQIIARVVPGADPASAAAASEEGIPVMVELLPPEGTARTPSDLCCVVDVSGSMAAEAFIKNETGDIEGHGLSVLDIVRHALVTIIRNMHDQDRLSVVAYSNEAHVVFPLTEMTDNAKSEKERQLEELKPSGMTNLWDGLKKGMETLKAGAEAQGGRLQHILLFTDGLPNFNPPRGILPMLQRMKAAAGGKLPCTINTFGFGYELDSELLSELAIEGSGSYAFIPDAGFVGTVFVNAMSNLLVTMAKDVEVRLEATHGAGFAGAAPVHGGHVTKKDDAGLTVKLGTMQYGQAKQVIVQMTIPPEAAGEGFLKATLEYTSRAVDESRGEAQVVTKPSPEVMEAVEPQRLRLYVVDCIRNVKRKLKVSSGDKHAGKPLPMAEAQDLVDAGIREFAASSASGREDMKALLEDLSGQVAEAISREDWYAKWGVHYLSSLMFAHLAQQCNNFKDAGVQNYGGKLFNEIRDIADDIFVALPPPTPSLKTEPPRRDSLGGTQAFQPPPAAASTAAFAAAPAPAPVLNMSSFYDRYAGCFDGESLVRLADGGLRRAADVRKGDVLAAADGGGALGEVLVSIRTRPASGRMPMVTLPGGLRITPYHPVAVDGEWRFPADIAPVEDTACDLVCTLLLAEGAHAAIVNDIPCLTLGHGLKEGAARHPYFSDWAKVQNDLARFPGFYSGVVELGPDSVQRDPLTGLVCSLAPSNR